jgi:aromatic-L-amino-acid decarboxylase
MDKRTQRLEQADRSLELNSQQLSGLLDTVLERLGPHLDSIDTQDAWQPPVTGQRPDNVLPAQGLPIEQVLDDLFEQRLFPAYNPASPGYMAYIPGGGLVHSAVADLIANIVNRYVAVWQTAPRLAELEMEVIGWFRQMLKLPDTASGFLTTGGSLANWSAVVTARRCRLPEDFLNGMIYTSDQAHHSIARAASLAGFPQANLRLIKSDGDYRASLEHLRQLIEEDRQAGQRPFMVVGHAGTTNTGAVDDLQGLAEICQQHELWFHVDAAYGGAFMLTERGQQAMAGIEQSDSVTLDPHKGMFLPYGTGCLMVRRLEDLYAAHAVDVDYLPQMQDDPYRADICQISPELSRDFRGLRVWLPIQAFGFDTFRNYLDEKLDLAHWATRQLQDIPAIEVMAAPQLSILAFRLKPDGLSEDELTKLNEVFLKRINGDTQRVCLSATRLDGSFAIRICIVVFRTHLDRVRECLELIRQAAEELTGALGESLTGS